MNGKMFCQDFDPYGAESSRKVCVDKKAHINMDFNVDIEAMGVDGESNLPKYRDGICWDITPCDGSCGGEDYEVDGAMLKDLEEFLRQRS